MNCAAGYISNYQKESLHDKRLSLKSCGGKLAGQEKRANSAVIERKVNSR